MAAIRRSKGEIMGNVTFNFLRTTIDASQCVLKVSNGTYVIDKDTVFSISGTIAFESIAATTHQISIGVDGRASFSAMLSVSIEADQGVDPMVTVFNFVGLVNIQW